MSADRVLSGRNLAFVFAILIPALVYTYYLVTAKTEFGIARILGWDTLAYAFSTQETLKQGFPWMLRHWNHPNSYALLLAGLSSLTGNVSLTANLLPVVFAALLSFASGYVVRKITNPATGLLAAILTATSMATFRIFVDLHRALFAFLGITILIALDSTKTLAKARLDLKGVLVIVLLLVVAFSNFEMYLAYLLSVILVLGLRRERWSRWPFVLGWSILPGLLFALTPAPPLILNSLFYVTRTGIAQGLTLEGLLLYFSPIISIPFAIFGVAFLMLKWKSKPDGLATPLLSWIVAISILLILFGIVIRMIPLYRAIISLHIPMLVALGAYFLIEWVVRLSRQTYSTLPRGHFLKVRLPDQTRHVAFAFFATALIIASGIGMKENSTLFWKPIVSQDLYARLAHSSEFLRDKGWPEPIYLVLNEQVLGILAPIRFELGLLNDNPTYLYYGDINLLPWFVHPYYIFPDWIESPAKIGPLEQEYFMTTFWLNPEHLDLLAHPLVVVSPELFGRTLPPSFEEFLVGEGLYVIPPNTLSLETFLSWEILAEEDSFGLGDAYLVDRNWTVSGKVVEIYTQEGYEIAFLHYFPIQGTYRISIHLFDFPPTDFGTTIPLSPLELLIGDIVVDTLFYETSSVIWWDVRVELDAGLHVIKLRTTQNDLPFRMSLDEIVVMAELS